MLGTDDGQVTIHWFEKYRINYPVLLEIDPRIDVTAGGVGALALAQVTAHRPARTDLHAKEEEEGRRKNRK